MSLKDMNCHKMKWKEGFSPKIKSKVSKWNVCCLSAWNGDFWSQRGSRFWGVKGEWEVGDGGAGKTAHTMGLVHKPGTAAFCYRHDPGAGIEKLRNVLRVRRTLQVLFRRLEREAYGKRQDSSKFIQPAQDKVMKDHGKLSFFPRKQDLT